MKIWGITGGRRGNDVLVEGVANALGGELRLIHTHLAWPSRWLAPYAPAIWQARQDPQIAPPYPALVLASGRRAVPYARHIRRMAAGAAFVGFLQNPHINPRHFDFVWAPAHDRVSGANVLSSLTSPHNLTPDILQNSARALRTTLLPTDFAGKVVSVLIGGASRAYKFSHATMVDLADQLAALATPEHFFLISLSRRSHPDCADILRAKIPPARLHIIEKTGDAAYPAMLGLADYIIATSDSTNMLGEACLTGKPIYRFDLAGGTARFRRFHNALENGGYVRPFIGALEDWHSTPLNATNTIAQAIKNAMRQKAASGQ